MSSKPEKIISGGQNGADLAGLVAAHRLGIATGGTAPKGWRVCDYEGKDASNPNLAAFGLVEHERRDYPPRTIANVADSDGTVWFGNCQSPGGRLTIGSCCRFGKPYIISPTPKQLRDFVCRFQIKTLNVAGNRESAKNPSIFQETLDAIVEAFR